MDYCISAKDKIWFLRVSHHISNTVYHQLQSVGTLQRRFHTEFGRGPQIRMRICRSFSKLTKFIKTEAQVGNHQWDWLSVCKWCRLFSEDHCICKDRSQSKQPWTELRLMKPEHLLFTDQKNQLDKLPNNLYMSQVTVRRIPWADFPRFKNYEYEVLQNITSSLYILLQHSFKTQQQTF